MAFPHARVRLPELGRVEGATRRPIPRRSPLPRRRSADAGPQRLLRRRSSGKGQAAAVREDHKGENGEVPADEQAERAVVRCVVEVKRERRAEHRHHLAVFHLFTPILARKVSEGHDSC